MSSSQERHLTSLSGLSAAEYIKGKSRIVVCFLFPSIKNRKVEDCYKFFWF